MNNFIHPTAIIEAGACVGHNNYIGPYCVIYKNTTIGNYNRFESFCSIGSPAEHRDHFQGSNKFGVIIGNNNVFREYVTVNAGTVKNTEICDNNIMLRGSHFGHDSFMEDGVTLSCNATIGGHSYLMTGSTMALNSVCHQFSVMGSYSFVGMGGVVTKQSVIKPGEIHVGNPCRFIKLNKIGLDRNGIDGEILLEEEDRYFNLCKKEI